MSGRARAYRIAKWRTLDFGAGQGAAAVLDWVPGEGGYWLHLFDGSDIPSVRFTDEATALATFRRTVRAWGGEPPAPRTLPMRADARRRQSA
jgi:hypothetical protein